MQSCYPEMVSLKRNLCLPFKFILYIHFRFHFAVILFALSRKLYILLNKKQIKFHLINMGTQVWNLFPYHFPHLTLVCKHFLIQQRWVVITWKLPVEQMMLNSLWYLLKCCYISHLFCLLMPCQCKQKGLLTSFPHLSKHNNKNTTKSITCNIKIISKCILVSFSDVCTVSTICQTETAMKCQKNWKTYECALTLKLVGLC